MATEQSVLAVIRASRPNFRNSADKIAFAVHSVFLATGFNLNATGPPAFTDEALTAPFSDEADIDGWNEIEDNYAFVYSSPEKNSKKVLVKCLVMNNKLFIDALAAASSDPVHLEINIDDFVGETEDSKYSSQFKNLGKLVDCINKDVLTKLSGCSASASGASSSSKPRVHDNDREEPRGGPYGLENPHMPYYPSGIVMPPVYPSIGGGDLYPQPGAGMYPSRGGVGDGGMLVGPNDPRFFGGVGGGPMRFPGGQPPGVPPGARFDPIGPPDVPGFEPNRFTRNPRRPPGGTHPDLEHFGNGSDFI